jgi:hypothetical protein
MSTILTIVGLLIFWKYLAAQEVVRITWVGWILWTIIFWWLAAKLWPKAITNGCNSHIDERLLTCVRSRQ